MRHEALRALQRAIKKTPTVLQSTSRLALQPRSQGISSGDEVACAPLLEIEVKESVLQSSELLKTTSKPGSIFLVIKINVFFLL